MSVHGCCTRLFYTLCLRFVLELSHVPATVSVVAVVLVFVCGGGCIDELFTGNDSSKYKCAFFFNIVRLIFLAPTWVAHPRLLYTPWALRRLHIIITFGLRRPTGICTFLQHRISSKQIKLALPPVLCSSYQAVAVHLQCDVILSYCHIAIFLEDPGSRGRPTGAGGIATGKQQNKTMTP